jgi:hypothetical protein
VEVLAVLPINRFEFKIRSVQRKLLNHAQTNPHYQKSKRISKLFDLMKNTSKDYARVDASTLDRSTLPQPCPSA